MGNSPSRQFQLRKLHITPPENCRKNMSLLRKFDLLFVKNLLNCYFKTTNKYKILRALYFSFILQFTATLHNCLNCFQGKPGHKGELFLLGWSVHSAQTYSMYLSFKICLSRKSINYMWVQRKQVHQISPNVSGKTKEGYQINLNNYKKQFPTMYNHTILLNIITQQN